MLGWERHRSRWTVSGPCQTLCPADSMFLKASGCTVTSSSAKPIFFCGNDHLPISCSVFWEPVLLNCSSSLQCQPYRVHFWMRRVKLLWKALRLSGGLIQILHASKQARLIIIRKGRWICSAVLGSSANRPFEQIVWLSCKILHVA